MAQPIGFPDHTIIRNLILTKVLRFSGGGQEKLSISYEKYAGVQKSLTTKGKFFLQASHL